MTKMKPEPRKRPVFSHRKCSAEFAAVLVHSNSTDVICEYCGRLHFSRADRRNLEEGRFDELCQAQKCDRDGFIGHNTGVRWGHWDGKQVVVNCPCGFAAHLEGMIWDLGIRITFYLKRRSERELAEARAKASSIAADVVGLE